MPFIPIVMSVPTSGAGTTAAATFLFATAGYKLPRQGRSSTIDTVHNQNGVFRYSYDNGPNFRTWEDFLIVCTDEPPVVDILGRGVTQQIADLEFLWQYVGSMGLQDPVRSYPVVWSGGQPLTPALDHYPSDTGDKLEVRYTVSLEEG